MSMRGFCPVHEYEWQECEPECVERKRVLSALRTLYHRYWRDRTRGVRRRQDVDYGGEEFRAYGRRSRAAA